MSCRTKNLAMYKIEKDLLKQRLTLTLDRYSDHDRMQFHDDMKQAALEIMRIKGHFDILADFTDSIVMPRDIAEDSEDMASWFVLNGLRRSANISQSFTQKMQIGRVTRRNDRFRIFTTRIEAEAWLES